LTYYRNIEENRPIDTYYTGCIEIALLKIPLYMGPCSVLNLSEQEQHSWIRRLCLPDVGHRQELRGTFQGTEGPECQLASGQV